MLGVVISLKSKWEGGFYIVSWIIWKVINSNCKKTTCFVSDENHNKELHTYYSYLYFVLYPPPIWFLELWCFFQNIPCCLSPHCPGCPLLSSTIAKHLSFLLPMHLCPTISYFCHIQINDRHKYEWIFFAGFTFPFSRMYLLLLLSSNQFL